MLSALLLAFCTPCFSDDNTAVKTAVKTVKSDFETFYLGKANLIRLGVGIGVAGLFANTNLDQEIRDWYQDDVRSSGTDNVAHFLKTFGNTYFTVPIYLGVYGAWCLLPSPALEKWAQESFRATLRTPAPLVLQPLQGGARPPESSHWKNTFSPPFLTDPPPSDRSRVC